MTAKWISGLKIKTRVHWLIRHEWRKKSYVNPRDLHKTIIPELPLFTGRANAVFI